MEKKREDRINIENPEKEKLDNAEEITPPASAEAEQVAEAVVKEPPEGAVVEETGVISANTRVVGNIGTNGHLAIYGEVEGNISARGDIAVANGKIEGDISCWNLRMEGCVVKTNIIVKDQVVLGENTKVEGKIQCRDITIDGSVKGDIDAMGEVNIYKNARIIGNIKTKALGIESGAEIQGNLMVVK